MFRALLTGKIVEIGMNAQEMFNRHKIDCAQKIVGDEVWAKICANELAEIGTTVFFEAERTEYVVTYSPTRDDQINVYLTRVN